MNSAITLVQACLLGAAFLVALSYFGFGATRFLLPASLREWRASATPFVGLALIVVWDYLALFFGINLTVATIALFAAVTAVNGLALRAHPLRDPSRLFRGKVGWGLLAVALLTFLAAVAPLVRYGYISIIGENWDYEFYLPLADALRTMPTSALAQAPSNPLLNVILSRHILPLPMGFSYLQSSLDVLLRLDALDSFAILLALLHALGVVSAFVFFRATLKMKPLAALAASAWLGLNGLLLWATYWNFGLHLTSLALLPIALTFGTEALLGPVRREPDGEGRAQGGQPQGLPLRTVPIAALLLAALNVTFHPTLIAALLPLAALGLYALIVGRARVRTLAEGVALITLTVALSFPTLFHIGDFLREYYGREPLATGLRDFIPLTDAYGLSQYSLELVVGHAIPTPALYELATRVWGVASPLLLLLALAGSVYALWQLRRTPTGPGPTYQDTRRAIWYTVVGSSLLYIAVFRLPLLHAYPYGFLKSLTLFSFVLVALAVEGISGFGILPRVPSAGEFRIRILRSTSYSLIAALIALTLFTFAITLEQYFKPAPPFFSADDLRLRALPGILPRGATVFLGDRSEVQKIPMGLAAYALREFSLYGDVITGYGAMNNAAAGAVYDYALLARGEDPAGRGFQTPPLWSNHKFALYTRTPGVLYHRALEARIAPSDALTLTLGANDVVTGTPPKVPGVSGQTVSPTVATRGLSLALASFVPQTATLTIGNTTQNLALAPGLSIYRIPEVRLPNRLTITTEVPPSSMQGLPGADISLFVPWVELREAGGVQGWGVQLNAPTGAVLVRCAGAGASDLDARCSVANPSGVTLRWEYVVRGTPKGIREDQELIRRVAAGNPQRSVEIAADPVSGLSRLQFDDLSPRTFPPQKLPDGNYRAALEIYSVRSQEAEGSDDVLMARIDLYRFDLAQGGSSLRRLDTSDPSLFILQP